MPGSAVEPPTSGIPSGRATHCTTAPLIILVLYVIELNRSRPPPSSDFMRRHAPNRRVQCNEIYDKAVVIMRVALVAYMITA